MWGGHEGSLLLWCCCFPPGARCLPGIIGSKPIAISADASRFISHARRTATVLVLWSDPFVRIFPPAIEGRDSIRCCNIPVLSSIRRCFISGWRFDDGGERGAGEFTAQRVYGACARICWRWALPGWGALTRGSSSVPGGPIANWAGAAGGLGPGGKRLFITLAFCHCTADSLSLTRQRGIFRHWSLLLA